MKRKKTHAEIVAMGGRAVPPEKRPYSRDRALASAAGKKGGMATAAKRWGFKPGDKPKRVRGSRASRKA